MYENVWNTSVHLILFSHTLKNPRGWNSLRCWHVLRHHSSKGVHHGTARVGTLGVPSWPKTMVAGSKLSNGPTGHCRVELRPPKKGVTCRHTKIKVFNRLYYILNHGASSTRACECPSEASVVGALLIKAPMERLLCFETPGVKSPEPREPFLVKPNRAPFGSAENGAARPNVVAS